MHTKNHTYNIYLYIQANNTWHANVYNNTLRRYFSIEIYLYSYTSIYIYNKIYFHIKHQQYICTDIILTFNKAYILHTYNMRTCTHTLHKCITVIHVGKLNHTGTHNFDCIYTYIYTTHTLCTTRVYQYTSLDTLHEYTTEK